MHKAKKGNPMLNKIHAAERSVYSQKLDIALQMGFDAACLAAHDVLQLGEGRFLKFADAYRERLNAIASRSALYKSDLQAHKHRTFIGPQGKVTIVSFGVLQFPQYNNPFETKSPSWAGIALSAAFAIPVTISAIIRNTSA